MNRVTVTALVALMVLGISSPGFAEGKIRLNIGGDVLLPMGDFGDGFSTGFGGTLRGEYTLNEMTSITATTGYFTWSAKDLPLGMDASFKGVPLLAGIKYYFMPAGAARVYGMGEVGVFFGTATASGEIFGIRVEVSESEAKFAYAPVLGVEIPAGPTATIDLSARYFGISTDPSANNFGLRAGVNFGL